MPLKYDKSASDVLRMTLFYTPQIRKDRHIKHDIYEYKYVLILHKTNTYDIFMTIL